MIPDRVYTPKHFDNPPLPKGFSSKDEYDQYARKIIEWATDLILLAHNNPKAVVPTCKAIEKRCRRKCHKRAFRTIRNQTNPVQYLIAKQDTLIPIFERAFDHE